MGSMAPLEPVKVSHKDKEKSDMQNQKEEKLLGSSCILSKEVFSIWILQITYSFEATLRHFLEEELKSPEYLSGRIIGEILDDTYNTNFLV